MTIPNDPWESLAPDKQDVFWSLPGSDFLDAGYDTNYAETLYAVGFGYTAAEYDAMGLDPDAVRNAREDFLNFMGMEWDQFPWDDWREAMGYDEG